MYESRLMLDVRPTGGVFICSLYSPVARGWGAMTMRNGTLTGKIEAFEAANCHIASLVSEEQCKCARHFFRFSLGAKGLGRYIASEAE
jgi:hypothetical protein